MSELMRKIVYYENILEFKENTKGELFKHELNNWQLCRTCLFETVANDVDLEKMCVMDMIEGRFLNVKEMLIQATGLKISGEEELPIQICKECFSKITTLYYFTIQVRKAETILKRLANKLKTQNQLETSTDGDSTMPDQSHMHKDRNFNDNSNEEMEINVQNDVKHMPDNKQCFEVAEANAECFEDLINPEDLDNKDDVILNYEEEQQEEEQEEEQEEQQEEQHEEEQEEEQEEDQEDFKNIDYLVELENEEEQEQYLDNDFHDEPDVQNIEEANKSEDINQELIILAEEVEDNLNKNDFQQVHLFKFNNPIETGSKKGFKHKQPRVKKSLLDDIKCAVCEKVFCRQRDLVNHVQLSHPNSKAFKCRDCGMQFAHLQSLSRHMNSHKDTLVTKTCEYCSKSFLRCDDLKRHIRVHTGERPYVCEMCDKAFKQQSEMKTHLLTHFPQTRQYDCNQCDRTFQSRNGLYLHRKSHKKIFEMELNSKKQVYLKEK